MAAKPLLIRQALPGYISPISPDELAGLALEEEVESRLVVAVTLVAASWPLYRAGLCRPASARLDAVGPSRRSGYRRCNSFELFAFLPPWRLDDVMVNFASRGSVGPHFDQYDVFLVQVAGTRRWQIGGQCDGSTPLRTIAKSDAGIFFLPGGMAA